MPPDRGYASDRETYRVPRIPGDVCRKAPLRNRHRVRYFRDAGLGLARHRMEQLPQEEAVSVHYVEVRDAKDV